MPIRAVTFDADDTLWDFSTVSSQASQAVVDLVRERHPTFEGDLDDLLTARRVVGEQAVEGTPFPLIRRMSIERFVASLDPATEFVDELTGAFFDHRDAHQILFDDVEPMLDALDDDLVVGVITNGNTRWKLTSIAGRIDFWLAADQIGVRKPDPRIIRMAAAAAGCRVRELVHVGDEPHSDMAAAAAAGARAVWIDRRCRPEPRDPTFDARIESLDQLPRLIAEWARAEVEGVGVGPHPSPWPEDERLDPDLLAKGDRRNVVDRFRYWRREAIVQALDTTRHPFHVAIENWQHDLNIGTIVRTANAFAASAVHIVGRRKWNRRGAMVTDRYQHVHYHETMAGFTQWCSQRGLPLIGVDNMAGSQPLETIHLPEACVLLFGQEGSGLSGSARDASETLVSIAQFGSTRSINAGVAAGIAMHAWIRQHGPQHSG